MDAAASDLLPEKLKTVLERETGATIVAVTPRGGGGASRSGAELTLRRPDGTEQRSYLGYRKSTVPEDKGTGIGSLLAFRREVAVLRALSGDLKASGVRAPEFLASEESHRGILSAFAPGEPNYNRLTSEADRREVGHDFMAQLARLHAIDLSQQSLDGFTPLSSNNENLKARLAELRRVKLSRRPDPLILLALDWLEANIPPEPQRPVILHGDAGPGNFMFGDGAVTALLDWELVHYGDPMADLAMVCIRNLFQPFIPLKAAFEAYETAGGARVELDRVRYYRVFFQAGFASPPEALNSLEGPNPTAFGTNLIYSTIHMRVLAEALAEAAGVALPPVELPERPLGAHHRSFMVALDDLKDVIAPRVADQEASAKAKSLARLVKWWRDLERWGPACAEAERQELSQALGVEVQSPEAGREMLVARLQAGTIDKAPAIRLCHARAARDAAVFADGMGALARSGFAPLD